MDALALQTALNAIDQASVALARAKTALVKANATIGLPSQREMTHKFELDEPSGLLVWRNGHATGKPIGGQLSKRDDENYPLASLNGAYYRVIDLVWLFHTGDWVPNQIRYRDDDYTNVAFDNLYCTI